MKETIQSLKLENFSLLPNDTYRFSPNLNIIIAENACGKSHLLKILYTLLAVTAHEKNRLLKTDLQKTFADKLLNVFRPDALGRLVKRQQSSSRCEMALTMDSGEQIGLDFSNHASTQSISRIFPVNTIPNPYFCPHENSLL